MAEVNECMVTCKRHEEAGRKTGYGVDNVKKAEETMRGMIGGMGLVDMGYSKREIEEVKRVFEEVDKEEEVGEELMGRYVKVIMDFEVKEFGSRDKERYSFKQIGYREMKRMLTTVKGKYRAEVVREIAVRFSRKVSEVVAERGEQGRIVSRGSVIEGWRELLDMVYVDFEREKTVVEGVLGIYRRWEEALVAGDKEAAVGCAREIKEIERENPYVAKIGMYEDDRGYRREYVGEPVVGSEEYKAKIAGLEEAVSAYNSVMGSWRVMSSLATIEIGKFEGVDIKRSGRTEKRMEEIAEWGEATAEMDDEETTEDLNRTASEYRAAWKSVPEEVRSVIGLCDETRDGQTRIGVFGQPRKVNARSVYQRLVLKLRTSEGSDEMLKRLADFVKDNPDIKPLYDKAAADERFRSSLFVCMKRGFQGYSQFKEKWEYGKRRVAMTRLNGRLTKRRSTITNVSRHRQMKYGGELIGSVMLENPLHNTVKWTEKSVDDNGRAVYHEKQKAVEDAWDLHGKMLYNQAGAVDKEVAFKLWAMTDFWYRPWNKDVTGRPGPGGKTEGHMDLMELIKRPKSANKMPIMMTGRQAVENGFIEQGEEGLWDQLRVDILLQSANAIGVEMDGEAAVNLVVGTSEGGYLLATFANAYNLFLEYNGGLFKKYATGEVKDSAEWMADGILNRNTPTDETFGKMDWAINNVCKQQDYSLKALARGKNGKRQTYESAIEPSFFTELIDHVRSYEPKRLKEWIEDTWLKDEKFRKGGFIFNPLLRTLYFEACNPTAVAGNALTSTMDFWRDLGTSEKGFEDMSDKEYLWQSMSTFFADEKTGYGSGSKPEVEYISAEQMNNLLYNGFKFKSTTRYIVTGWLDQSEEGNIYFSDEPPAGQVEEVVPGYKPQTVVTFGEDNQIDTFGTYKQPTASYTMFVQGDANASRYVTLQRYGEDDIMDEFYNVFQSELARMQQVRELKVSIANYTSRKDGKDNGEQFTILTFLNAYVDEAMQSGELASRQEVIESWTEDDVRGMILREMDMRFHDFLYELDELGLFETMDNGVYRYMDGITNLNPGFFGVRQGEENPRGMESYYKGTLDKLKDFFFNYKLAQISMCQMFDIDPSMFVNIEDMQKRHKQVVANGEMLDLDATYKGDTHASLHDKYEHSVYVDDIETNCEEYDPEFMAGIIMRNSDVEVSADEALAMVKAKDHEAIKAVMGANRFRWRYMPYTKNTLTDGQAWRSLTSYRSIMIRRGAKWWTQREEDAYKAIQEIRTQAAGRDLKEEEIRKIEKCAAVFQPLKPFSYGFEKIEYNGQNEDGNDIEKTAVIGTQRKCSDCVVIPELLEKGSKLRAMAEYMEQTQQEAGDDVSARRIDCVYSVEAVKVGCFGSVKLTGSVDEFVDRLKEVVSTGVGLHDMHWKYYRIQTNMSDHLNENRRIGTQLIKIMMSDIDFSGKTDYIQYFKDIMKDDGICIGIDEHGNKRMVKGSMGGKELNELYQTLFVCNIIEAFARFEQELSTMENISDSVVDSLMGNLRANIDSVYGFMLTGDDTLVMPLFEPSVLQDTSGALLARFRNIVNKQMARGGSAIQQSPYGLTREYVDGDVGGLHVKTDAQHNTIDVDCELSWAEEYTDSKGRTVALRFEDWNEMVDGRWELKKDADGIPLLEKEFPGILDIIAYRIPTERAYSVLKLHVKRFSPHTGGGTIKVPHQFTTVAGFDFDIDKLYMLRKSFIETKSEWERLEISKEDRRRIIARIADKYQEEGYVKEIPPLTETDFSQSQLWEIFGVIYGDNPDVKLSEEDAPKGIKEALQYERLEGDKTPLNRFWESSVGIESMAKRRGFSSSLEYKNFLVQKAADALGIIPEVMVEKKSGYLTLDKDKIATDGKTVGQLFREAAREEGIKLAERKNEERWQEYDPEKPPLEQSSSAVRTNMILHIMQQRLADPETFISRMTPGGFDGAKSTGHLLKYLTILSDGDVKAQEAYEKAKRYEESVSENRNNEKSVPYDFSDPMTVVRFNKQNQIAAKLIGIFANDSTNNIFSQLLDKFEIVQEHRVRMFDNVTRQIGNRLVGQANDAIRNLIDYNMAQSLAASVDAVKMPVFNLFNITEHTANVAGLMLRTGYEYEDVALFLQQPIIVEVTNMMAREGLGFDTAASRVAAKYFGKEYDITKLPGKENEINRKDCAADITRYKQAKEEDKRNFVDRLERGEGVADRTHNKTGNVLQRTAKEELFFSGGGDAAFVSRQKACLAAFVELAGTGQALSDWLMTTKATASNTVGSTMGAMYSKMAKSDVQNIPERFEIAFDRQGSEKTMEDGQTITFGHELADGTDVDGLLLTTGKDDEEIKNDRNRYLNWLRQTPFMIEQAMTNVLGCAMRKVFSKVFPFETDRFKTLLNMASGLTNSGMLSGDQTDRLFTERILWEMSQYGVFNFDRPVKVKGRIREIEISYGAYLADHFLPDYKDFINKWGSKATAYKLFDDGINVSNDNLTRHQYNGQELRPSDIISSDEERDELMSEVLEIMEHNVEDANDPDREFYKEAQSILINLFAYGVMRGGFEVNAQNFNRMMPTEFKRKLVMGGRLEDGNLRFYDEVLRSMLQDSGMGEQALKQDTRKFLIAFAVKNLEESKGMVSYITEDKFPPNYLNNRGQAGKSEGNMVLNTPQKLALAAKHMIVDKGGRKRYVMPPVIVKGTPWNKKEVWVLDVSGMNSDDFTVNESENVQYIPLLDQFGHLVDINKPETYKTVYSQSNSYTTMYIQQLKRDETNNDTDELYGSVMEHEPLQQLIPEAVRSEEAEAYDKLKSMLEELENAGEDVRSMLVNIQWLVGAGNKLSDIVAEVEKGTVRDQFGQLVCR